MSFLSPKFPLFPYKYTQCDQQAGNVYWLATAQIMCLEYTHQDSQIHDEQTAHLVALLCVTATVAAIDMFLP